MNLGYIKESIEIPWLYIRACLDCVIYVLHVLGHIQLAIKFNVMISSYHTNDNIYLQKSYVIL